MKLLALLFAAVQVGAAGLPAGYRLLFEESFDRPEALESFTFTDPAAWKFAREEKGGALELASQSKYQPPVRSPVNIALIEGKIFGDFILEVDMIQTGREYGHRDMCVFFGFQKPSQFYYTHIATKADPNAHNIFVVNEKPRTNIAEKTTSGANWGLDVWRKIRVERKVAEGTVKVYFDDMTQPIMTTTDKTFGEGRIGFGSFDDTGKIDNIKIWGPSAGKPSAPVTFKAAK